MRRAAAFLAGLFEVSRDHWYPMLVVVDEAQLFAPPVAGEVSDEARKLSLGAMTDLMCRGRKRGLAGVIATQRLAKLPRTSRPRLPTSSWAARSSISTWRAPPTCSAWSAARLRLSAIWSGAILSPSAPPLSRRPLSLRIAATETEARNAKAPA